MTRPQGPVISGAQRESVCSAVSEALGEAYDCLRVWSAWGCGTMCSDDFRLVAEDETRVAEIADAGITALHAAPAAPPEGCVYVSQELLADYNAMKRAQSTSDTTARERMAREMPWLMNYHQMPRGGANSAAHCAAAPACQKCDGTGDVHRADGEWHGRCSCAAPPAPVGGVQTLHDADLSDLIRQRIHGLSVYQQTDVRILIRELLVQSAPLNEGGSEPVPVPGLVTMSDDDGTVTLRFESEYASQAFMRRYGPTVEIDADPAAQADEDDDDQGPPPPVEWDRFPGWLIDRHEGETITEELLQHALADMLKVFPAQQSATPTEPAAPQPSARALTDAQIEAIWQATPTDGIHYIYGEPAKELRIRFARALLAAEQPSEGKRAEGGA